MAWLSIGVGTCRFLVLGTSLQFGHVPDLFYFFHEVFCQSIGLWVIWCNNSGFDPCSFHVDAIFMTVAAIDERVSIRFQFVRETMCENTS